MVRNLKIVHVMNWYIPGLGYQENILPVEQKKLGHEVNIITSDRFPYYRGYENHIGKIKGNRIMRTGCFSDNDVNIYRLPCIFELKRHGETFLIGLKKHLMKLQPDIVHAHGTFSPLTLLTIHYCKNIGIPIVIDDHSHEDNFFLHSLITNIYLKIVKKFYNIYIQNISFFLPVTYSSSDIIKSTLTIPKEKIEILHLGANTHIFKKSKKSKKEGRTEIGIEDDEVLIISSGKFTESKDIHVLIKAFVSICRKYSNVKLLLVGNGSKEYMRYLKELVDTFDIKDEVIFHDFVVNIELPKFYNAADIGVWPGDHTITAIEAAATGLPVIIPLYNPAYLILFNNQSAIGFERGNINSLYEKISMLIEDTKKREKISTQALRIVEKELSWEIIAKKSLQIYIKAIGV